jgi:hypothetical protein
VKMTMRDMALVLVLAFYQFVGTAKSSDDTYFAADGVVVAVQKTKDEARMYDPNSMGDLVEVWMLRIEKWPRPERPNFVLVEYTHRDDIVKDSALDGTVWKFEIRPTHPAESGTCMSWWTQTFMPTALGANQKLPPPKNLACFLMKNRPVALRDAKAHREKTTPSTTP